MTSANPTKGASKRTKAPPPAAATAGQAAGVPDSGTFARFKDFGSAPLSGGADGLLRATVSGPTVAAGSLVPKPQFLTEPNSPFADGYSIRLEEEFLAEFLALPQPLIQHKDHQHFWRWLELDERIGLLKERSEKLERRLRADPLVDDSEIQGMKDLGTLVAEEPDEMTIHTKEAYRLFMGRANDPNGAYKSIPGAKRNAAALKALWMLTRADNPYADWALVRHEQNLGAIMKQLRDATDAGRQAMEHAANMGLKYSVLRSVSPKTLTLGFKSPYGFAMAELVVSFDYFVRVWKTLEYKNLRSDDQVRNKIREMLRTIRAKMIESTRFERWLNQPELHALSRADFLPGQPEESRADAGKRMEAAMGIFGPVPAEIFAGMVVPRHSRRRQNLTPLDRKLLQEVSAQMALAEQEAVAVGAEADESLI